MGLSPHICASQRKAIDDSYEMYRSFDFSSGLFGFTEATADQPAQQVEPEGCSGNRDKNAVPVFKFQIRRGARLALTIQDCRGSAAPYTLGNEPCQ